MTSEDTPERLDDALAKRVLVIDDDTEIVGFVDKVLRDAGYEVYTAENGQEGLAQALLHLPHLVLLDLAMPVIMW